MIFVCKRVKQVQGAYHFVMLHDIIMMKYLNVLIQNLR